MVLLREQRNLIKALYDIRENDEAIEKLKASKKVEALLGMANEAEILGYLKNKQILLGYKPEFPTQTTDKGYFIRASKLGVLLQSCVDAGFLVPFQSPSSDSLKGASYYKISDRGSDLLHFFGFWQISFEKYSRTIIFLWGALSIVT